MTALSHTASVEVLTDLLVRLEGAEGISDRRRADLACDLHHTLLAPTPRGHSRGSASGRYLMFHKNRGHGVQAVDVPDYLGSFDAAWALVGRVLPGRRIMLWQDIGDDDWGAHFRSPDTDTEYAATPALALLCALVQDLIANGARDLDAIPEPARLGPQAAKPASATDGEDA